MDPFVIVGGGPAAAAAARQLARAEQPVVVLTAEPYAPYDRTTLSKSHLLGGDRPPLWPDDEITAQIDLRTDTTVTAIDPRAWLVRTAMGNELRYRRLLLATGARPRQLPGFTGPGVHTLRHAADVAGLTSALAVGRRLVIIGGGLIGLEVAASARNRGVDVVVLEVAERVLGRGVPEPVAQWLVRHHIERGVDIRTGVKPVALERDANGSPSAVRLQRAVGDATQAGAATAGESIACDAVLVGIGMVPNTELALAAGLAVDDGILVDTACRTSVEGIYAAGDVTRMNGVRLEAYQAAGRQGEVAAASMLGEQVEFTDVPWSWSDQFDLVLQVAGLPGRSAVQVDLTTPDAALVLSFEPTASDADVAVASDLSGDRVLVGVCGATQGPQIARPIRAATNLIAAGGSLSVEKVIETRGDLTALTALFRSATSR